MRNVPLVHVLQCGQQLFDEHLEEEGKEMREKQAILHSGKANTPRPTFFAGSPRFEPGSYPASSYPDSSYPSTVRTRSISQKQDSSYPNQFTIKDLWPMWQMEGAKP